MSCPMYCPKAFAQVNDANESLQQLATSHPLATIAWIDPETGVLIAEHIPLLYDLERHVLEGHVALANPFWKAANGQRILVIFEGMQGYISPSWYASKSLHHKVVPTWNYQVAHIQGTLNVIRDENWLKMFLEKLIHARESVVKSFNPEHLVWEMSDAPDEYIQQQVNGIVGISIPIDALSVKFKMGQNKKEFDVIGVVKGLSAASMGDESREFASMIGKCSPFQVTVDSEPTSSILSSLSTFTAAFASGTCLGLVAGLMIGYRQFFWRP